MYIALISVNVNAYRAIWNNRIGLSIGVIGLQAPDERQNIRVKGAV